MAENRSPATPERVCRCFKGGYREAPYCDTCPNRTQSEIERPKDFDAALERIDACCREVQVLCDEFDIDPTEYLADDEPKQTMSLDRALHPEHYPEGPQSAASEKLGFNEFLGLVQGRLIKDGYNPPAWPDTIRDQGDLEAALDSCVQWCKDRLEDPGTEKLLRDLLDRGYKMHVMAGTTTYLSAQDADQNDPLLAWLSDVRSVLYGKTKPVPEVTNVR